jgi:hypothetical protein
MVLDSGTRCPASQYYHPDIADIANIAAVAAVVEVVAVAAVAAVVAVVAVVAVTRVPDDRMILWGNLSPGLSHPHTCVTDTKPQFLVIDSKWNAD